MENISLEWLQLRIYKVKKSIYLLAYRNIPMQDSGNEEYFLNGLSDELDHIVGGLCYPVEVVALDGSAMREANLLSLCPAKIEDFKVHAQQLRKDLEILLRLWPQIQSADFDRSGFRADLDWTVWSADSHSCLKELWEMIGECIPEE
ncbi:hypothetical protein ACQKLP_10780 [Chitinophaga sp. NPDC101104]|uniref:hypothetical protein n=1 Tax=Chitinophaga sp. NPDC101104 TaxID=3390561 RepID=UPI003D016792